MQTSHVSIIFLHGCKTVTAISSGYNSTHMISTPLGYFNTVCFILHEYRNIEEILAAKGEHAKIIDGSSNTIEISDEDAAKLAKINNS